MKIFSFPSCTNNINGCLKCNPLTNLCEICSNSNYLIPDNNGGCKYSKICHPGINYCKECDSNEKLCVSCDDNSHPDEIGGCTMAENCKASYKGKCLECKENFILIGRENEFKICKSLFSDDFINCEKINRENGECQTCKEGYYLNSGDHKCIKIENCFESIFGNCILCNPEYYYDKKNDLCKRKNNTLLLCRQTIDEEKCDICDEGRYFDEEGICTFGKYCSKSLKGYCEKCIEGYYLANNKFCSFSKNCEKADNDIGICIECEKGFYLDMNDYKCKSNEGNNILKYCKKALNNLCIKCENNYYISNDKKCSNTRNCEESENGICKLCTNDYHLGLDNNCINIEHCIYSENNECVQCENNYFYNKLGKNCSLSYGILENCKISNEGKLCSHCHLDYYLRANDSLCLDNTKEGPFYKCEVSDEEGEKCSYCIYGYTIGKEDKKCSLVEYCAISENENRCIKCQDYYCLDAKKGICFRNDLLKSEEDKKYFSCYKTTVDGDKCEECLDGYEVGKEGYCIDINRCEEKQNEICVKCKNDMDEKGSNFCANDVFGCVPTYDENCLKCNNLLKLNFCTECKKGYVVDYYGSCINEELVS